MADDLDIKPSPGMLLGRAKAEDTEARALESRADTGLDALEQGRAAEFERRKGERAADASHIEGATADMQKTLGERPHTDMPRPDIGPMLDPEQTQKFAMGLLTMSLIGAAAGRKHWGESMAAIDGMLQGMKAGNEQLIAEKKAKFEREFRVAKEKQAEAIKVYDDILASKKLSLNMQAEMMRIHSAANGDWDMEQLAREKRFDRMYARVGQMRGAADKLTAQATQFQDKLDARAEKAEERRAKAAAGQSQGSFTEQDVAYWAEVMQKGGSLPPRLATTPGGKWLVQQVMSRISGGKVSPSQMLANQAEFQGTKAAERTAGVRGANVEMAVSEAHNMIEIVRETSRAFDRTNFMPVNKAIKAWQDNTGSTESRRFGGAVNSLINAYARAISPSGTPTVSDKDHAREVLSTADSPDQIDALLDLLNLEMEAARKSPKQVRGALRDAMTGGDGKTVNWTDLK